MIEQPLYVSQKDRRKSPRDRLGNELKVGDLICYVLHNFNVNGAAIFVGTITRISPKNGDVYAKNIPLAKNERSEEKKVKDWFHVMKIEKDFIDQILLRKLAA